MNTIPDNSGLVSDKFDRLNKLLRVPSNALLCTLVMVCTCFGLGKSVIAQDEALKSSDMDRAIRIQDDLFRHVNGNWLKTVKIPEDKSNYGSFGKLADLSQVRIKKIVEQTAQSEHPSGSNAQKIADLYKSFMDQQRVDELGIGPLESELEKIGELNEHPAIWEHFGYLNRMGVSSPVGFGVSQDPGKATQYITLVVQSGLSLPDRSYYLESDNNSAKTRRALQVYIHRLFELAGIDDGFLAAEEILALEKKLAEISWPRVELRDAEKRYNKMSYDKAMELTGGRLDWSSFFAAADMLETPDEVNVITPSYFEKLVEVFEKTPTETWVRYLQYRLIDSYGTYLSQDFVDAHFELYEKQLGGVPAQRPRWKRAVNLIAGRGGGDFGALGEAVGELYVAEYFKPEAKAEMELLVGNLLKAFEGSIADLTWMTDETKQKAKLKLAKIGTKIGYPNVWRDYSKLEIKPDDLYGNVRRSNVVEHLRQIRRLGQPIDREQWGMTPQTVNAYYSPSKNEIVFPAAILQPPFFDLSAADGLNYGGIGAVIGHEISHGFDDQGSRYDGDGNLNNWWSDVDAAEFKKLTSRLVQQFSEYSPLEGKFVDGELTLGENIADLSGLAIAHKALRIARKGEPEEKVAGWNSDQLFFVGWSRIWQRKYRDMEMIKRLSTDSHSPSQFRTNGPVTNIAAFYEAFGLEPGDKLYKPESDRIKIW